MCTIYKKGLNKTHTGNQLSTLGEKPRLYGIPCSTHGEHSNSNLCLQIFRFFILTDSEVSTTRVSS